MHLDCRKAYFETNDVLDQVHHFNSDLRRRTRGIEVRMRHRSDQPIAAAELASPVFVDRSRSGRKTAMGVSFLFAAMTGSRRALSVVLC